MFGWLKRKRQTAPADSIICTQPHGEVFPWPEGAVLTAIDEAVLALPMGVFENDRPMAEFLFGSDDMQINIPQEGDTFLIRLMPGMSVSLARSVQAYVVAEDMKPRRFRVTRPPTGA